MDGKTMKIKKSGGMKTVQKILGFLTLCTFALFILGEMVLPSDKDERESTYQVFLTDWVEVLADGTHIPLTVPGYGEAKRGEWMTMVTVLKEEQEDIWLCIRSMQQDMKIYVGDELRTEYSTIDTQLFGKTSTMNYVFIPLYEKDAGKVLRMEIMTESSYAGYVNEIVCGERSDIERHLYSSFLPEVVVAVLLLIIGVLVVFGSVFVRHIYKRESDLVHLANAMVIASMWILVESKLRQFIFPNTTVAMWMGFLLIALVPYPFGAYINSIQNGRYQKFYMGLGIATAINYVLVLLLQILNIKDFYESMIVSHIIIVVLILLITVTIVCDIAKGYAKAYREVIIGLLIVVFAGVCEISLVYVAGAKTNGIALCIGMALLLITAALKSIRDIFNVEKEKQVAIAASKSKANFLAGMSHEIRTPINTVIGMNEMILRENKDETIAEYANYIKSASQMLLGLINDVLDFSKIEAGKMQIVTASYEVLSMLNTVILGGENRARKKNLNIEVKIDKTVPRVLKGDEIRIQQVLNNLLSNAVKYTEKGTITVSVKGIYEENTFYLVVSVADTGIGIKKEDLDRLFSEFQRLELEKNRYIEGTGLGLKISEQLVEAMNGTITVHSEYGVGSCFTVRIPQEIGVDAMGEAVMEEATIGDTGLGNSQKEGVAGREPFIAPEAKILVVDDNTMNLKVMKALLKRSQVQLDMATGGNECLQMTKNKKYDLILMDHMMPQPDGIETLHLIREDKDNCNCDTNIIVLTANAIEGMKEQYLQEGFSEFLPKPVRADQLEEMLRHFINS